MKTYLSIIEKLKAQNVTLVAVSKTKPQEAILEMYEAGQRIFGENRVQELLTKYEALPKDIEWHLIGHLQSNKVKYIAPFVSMIHSVESAKLLKEINKEAANNGRVIDCLLQMKIAEEDSKFGMTEQDARLLLDTDFSKLKNIRLVGVMGMATFTEDMVQVQAEFQRLKGVFDALKYTYFENEPSFKEISMGMSGDYEQAIAAGSTMVRIGSLIFGKR